MPLISKIVVDNTTVIDNFHVDSRNRSVVLSFGDLKQSYLETRETKVIYRPHLCVRVSPRLRLGLSEGYPKGELVQQVYDDVQRVHVHR